MDPLSMPLFGLPQQNTPFSPPNRLRLILDGMEVVVKVGAAFLNAMTAPEEEVEIFSRARLVTPELPSRRVTPIASGDPPFPVPVVEVSLKVREEVMDLCRPQLSSKEMRKEESVFQPVTSNTPPIESHISVQPQEPSHKILSCRPSGDEWHMVEPSDYGATTVHPI